MPDPLLVTKLNLPVLRHLLVPRNRLLGQINKGILDGHLLTLVSAPAGYGKTTLIRMWVEETERAVAWVTLEKSDNDLKQFFTYILTSLGLAREDLAREALEAVENARELNLQAILGMLIRDLVDLERPLILVLEDYHLIENEKIDQFIEWVLNQALKNMHLVMTTREDPNLPLTRLRVRNQLTEIRAVDLSFSLEETAEFFSSVMGVDLSDKQTAILNNRTEGWVAGLQLAALSLRESEDPNSFVEAFRGTHRHVLGYLIEEVLDSQPEEIREFLRRTSILDQLCPSLCEAVTDQEASRKYLHHLDRNNLFLVALDEEQTWFRYHALFAELLKDQLLQAEPERVDELHERAAGWYEKNGFIQKAVEHAFQTSSVSKVSQLLEKHTLPMIYQGEISTVGGWFERLAEPLAQYPPKVHIGRAWSLVLMRRQATRTEEIEQALQAAGDALNRTTPDESLRRLIAGHTASIQAFLMGARAITRERPRELIEIAQKAQDLLPQDEKAIRSVNAMVIGNGYLMLADLPAAETAFEQTLEDGVAGGNFYAAVYGPINLILIAMMQGQLKDALQSCEANIDRFNQLVAGQRFPPIGALYILKGILLLEENLLTEAEDALTQGLSLVHWTGEFRTHIKGFSALARLRAIQGNWVGMSESLKSLEETRPEGAQYAKALRHRFSVQAPAANKVVLEEAQLWVTGAATRFHDLPDITGMDPVSETYFRTHLSAAHVLTRLAAQNPQAYSLPEAHQYFARQEEFAKLHGLLGWQIEIWILRALMYHVEGRTKDAQRVIQAALAASAPRGYFRIFLGESDLIRPLLKSVEPGLKDKELSAFVRRLLEAMPGESVKNKFKTGDQELLSDRELEVLRLLTAGQSYKEVGQNLFLSLNTVQFHVKSIYRKLSVNKRTQAIEKATEMNLI